MEESWFETYTWNGEPNTRYIIIRQRKWSQPIRDMVDKTLKNLGFEDQTNPEYKKAKNQSTLVDLSSKTFEHLSIWNAGVFRNELGQEVPYAYPSQISIFLAKHYGSLAGHQYGI
jgi:hypothetical protein